MRKLIIASGNEGKLREMKAILGHLYDEILSMKEAGIGVDVVEDADTFAGNAAKKAIEISHLTEYDVVSDDSGLVVDGLGGRPGVHSARYSERGTDEDNNKKLVEEVSKIDPRNRTAHYACAIVLARKGVAIFSCEGKCYGEIILEPKGENGFGYDPYFFMLDHGMTMAQMDSDLKNKISHRALALRKLQKFVEGEQK